MRGEREREPLLIASTNERIDEENPSTSADEHIATTAVARDASTRRRSLRALATSAAAACLALGTYNMNRELGEQDMMVQEYGGTLCTLRWDSTNGFHVSGGAREVETKRIERAGDLLEKTIERYYPSRLKPGSTPFKVYFEVDDAPHTRCSSRDYATKHCHFENWQPIFAFGSSPRNKASLPTMLSATLFTLIDCISPAETLGSSPTLDVNKHTEPRCEFLDLEEHMEDMSGCDNPASGKAYSDCNSYGLFNIASMQNKTAYEWDNLIDKAIWRGSDYMFLWGADQHWPNAKLDGASFFHEILAAPDRREKMEQLVASNRISPRFKAVLMSKLRPDVIDAKFFQSNLPGAVLRARARRDPLEVDTNEHIEQDTLGKYRYQLDLGGGGGTTWTGTISKLAMPGVLLHHETSMKDSYFDLLEPYKHYLPLKEDLSNFDELIQYVKDNPQKAKEISAAATEWVKKFRTLGNLLRHNYDTVATPLANVLGVQPIPFHVAHPKL